MFARAAIAVTAIAFFFVLAVAAAVATAMSVLLGEPTRPSPAAEEIPADYLALYQHAATLCPGLDWSVLAAIGKIETNHGRSSLPGVHSGTNYAGAGGPMQFLEATFSSVVETHRARFPLGGATPPSRYNPHDAIHAAAFYLCDNGAPRALHHALLAYNHSEKYVRDVLDQAARYRTSPPLHRTGWVRPVSGVCTSGFGARGNTFHRGQDIAAPIGTPILASADGQVISSGPASGYGLWVRIRHAGGVITTYGHNNRNLVGAGQHVSAGQPIAEVGNRGQSTGPHVHFQADIADHPVDPVAFYRYQGSGSLCGQRR